MPAAPLPESFRHSPREDFEAIIDCMKKKRRRKLVFQFTEHYHNEAVCRLIIEEIMIHKWIESEKLGRNAFEGSCGMNQLIKAGMDWVSKGYYRKFLEYYSPLSLDKDCNLMLALESSYTTNKKEIEQ